MAFTGQLGTEESYLGNLALGFEGGGGTEPAQFTSRARIAHVFDEDFTSRARILHASALLGFTSRARIRTIEEAQFTSRARIQVVEEAQFTSRARIIQASAVLGFTSRARIQVEVSGGLEVSFSILEPVSSILAVQFNVSSLTVHYNLFTSQARIKAIASARLPVDFTIDYEVPSACVVRPTTRVNAQTATQFHSRARIVSPIPPV